MRRLARLIQRLARDSRGIAATEFGLIAPIFLLLLVGLFDMSHMAYIRVIFDGVVQRAARSSSLEGADTATADNMIFELLKPVIPGVQRSDIKTKRMSYYDFADIKRPEKLTDKNGNGKCDKGENYIDENANGQWDDDIGSEDNGGAGDVVLYTAEVTYKPLFTIPFAPGLLGNRTLTATAVKKNQPFRQQTSYETTVKTCT